MARRSIEIKSGIAANVVPKPATSPTISERWKRIRKSAQPHSANASKTTTLPRSHLPSRSIFMGRYLLRAARSGFAEIAPFIELAHTLRGHEQPQDARE